MTMRIPYGLERLPRTLSPDDPRLPGVTVRDVPLRLNSEPLPADAEVPQGGGHAARVAAMRRYLHTLCGDYAPQRQRFVDCYLDGVAACLDANRAALARDLERYHGLYQPDDWLWSAWRPLPRAWLPAHAGRVLVDIAFWDGAQAIAVDLGGSLHADGIAICRIAPAALSGDPLPLLDLLPEAARGFWRGETLPRSPFRREMPLGVLA